ncbi:MAG: ABC transporter ATP-binding protein [Myxococcales bacterium]|nr:ABC transporter ATP-binding protein [Myxococcales bacterium]
MSLVLDARDVGLTVDGHAVLHDVGLQLQAGEVFGLIGPNGGGKSTLLLVLAGLVAPTAGTVQVDGVDAEQLALLSSGVVGLITAEPGLYPLLTGRENLHFFGGLYGLSSSEVDERAEPVARSLGVAEQLDRPSTVYSSGMRQKVSLARALLLRPKVLLLDEPTSNLDPLSSETLHRAVRSQADESGVAVVLATHDLHAAEHVCDRVGAVNGTLARVEAVGRGGMPARSRLHDLFEAALGSEP